MTTVAEAFFERALVPGSQGRRWVWCNDLECPGFDAEPDGQSCQCFAIGSDRFGRWTADFEVGRSQPYQGRVFRCFSLQSREYPDKDQSVKRPWFYRQQVQLAVKGGRVKELLAATEGPAVGDGDLQPPTGMGPMIITYYGLETAQIPQPFEYRSQVRESSPPGFAAILDIAGDFCGKADVRHIQENLVVDLTDVDLLGSPSLQIAARL